jgi:Wadjet protein JetA
MSIETTTSLGTRLLPFLDGGFFRPLARPSAQLYVDCADRLELASDEGGQLSHADAIALVRDALAAHPGVKLDEDEGGQFGDLRQRAGQIFNRLLEAGWLEERPASLDERWVVLSPRLPPLLALLREFAENDLAELKDFAATVRSVCETLLAEGALDPAKREPEELRQVVKELLDRVTRAGQQMRAVETVVLRYAQEQRVSTSPNETLRRFLIEFHEGEHMVCYDTLERGGLLPKLKQARLVTQDALASALVKQRLAEGIALHRALDETTAYGEAEEMLSRLERAIAGISTKQGIIDSRIADFSKLSAARYRYQTEMRGRRPELVKAYLQAADQQHAGQSFADLANLPGMMLLSPAVEFYFGQDALARPRRARLPVDLSMAKPPAAGDALDALERIRKQNLYAVTPQRAGRLIEKLLPEKGAALSTADLHLGTEDDLLDFLAVLAYERASGKRAHKPIRWRIRTARHEHGLEPEKIPTDIVAGRRVERLTIERTA